MRLATEPQPKLTPMNSARTNRLVSPIPKASSTTVQVDLVAQAHFLIAPAMAPTDRRFASVFAEQVLRPAAWAAGDPAD